MVAFLGFALTSNNLNAQESFASGGIEVAIPIGDFGEVYPLGIGVSGQYEFGISKHFGVTGSIGYTFLTVDSELSDLVKTAYMVPLQVGVKYYLDESRKGLFLAAQVGLHNVSVTLKDLEILGLTIEGETDSETDLSFAPEVGYYINENISLALRFNIISAEEELKNYLGFRAAYNF